MNAKFVKHTLILFLPYLVFRLLNPSDLSLQSLGLISDFLVAMVIAGIIIVLSKKKYVFVVTSFLLHVLCYSNLEHINAHGWMLPLDFKMLPLVFNGTFMSGSAVNDSLYYFAASFFVSIYFFRNAAFSESPVTKSRFFKPIVLLASILAVSVHQEGPFSPAWLTQNHLISNLRLVSFESFFDYTDMKTSEEKEHEFVVDGGRLRVPAKRRAKNVLLILIESLSGTYLKTPSFNKNNIFLKHLNKTAYDAMFFRHFIAHNRQTNRGEYSIFCGRHPNLKTISAKMDLAPKVNPKLGIKCLPEALSEAGYQTAYLQATNLRYMKKNKFMTAVGFERSYGDRDWFKAPFEHRTNWGPGDKDFFEQSLKLVRNLDDDSRPWFLSMLTVGTHHPFSVPKSWNKKTGKGPVAESNAYMDESLNNFLGSLRAQGVLDNTLVIITGDESNGYRRKLNTRHDLKNSGDSFRKYLAQNWTPLIILDPRKTKQVIDDTYTHSDMYYSIFDYLGLNPPDSLRNRRSYFRVYSKPRQLKFSNIFAKKLSLFDEESRQFLVKPFRGGMNWQFQFENTKFLWSSYKEIPTTKDLEKSLDEFLRRNDWTTGFLSSLSH